MSVVLMYHGLYRDDVDLRQRIAPEDRPYAVSIEEFSKQLSVLNQYSTGLLQPEACNNPQVILTFDDGHISNYDLALPLLLEHGIAASFFVTSNFIDERQYFCNSRQLREMADAGMVIGGHGKTHRFFSDMGVDEAVEEFISSKKILEDATGRCVDTMSFPGGRFNLENIDQAEKCGYREIYGSGFGAVALRSGSCISPINRIALRDSTSIDSFKQVVGKDRQYYFRETVKSSCKTALKRVLGNHRYHALYKFAAQTH